jgi:nucleotide-binding universal stress UspA family protein
MYRHVLIPTDGSTLSEQAIRHGVALAAALGARVTGLTVSPPFHKFSADQEMMARTPEQYESEREARAGGILAAVRGAAQGTGVPCETVHLAMDHPWEAIVETARERGCDLIVMASHGRRGVPALVLGSQTVKVLTQSKVPVLVCR